MNKLRAMQIYVMILVLINALPTTGFAIKEFKDAFKDKYAGPKSTNEFKTLVENSKCNVCHIDGENKKKRNPYGNALKQLKLDKNNYQDLLRVNPARAKAMIDEIFKKAEGMKVEGSERTFGEKISSGELPGGDVKGK